jgi:hemerythrin-like domain-containing protein
VSATTTPYTHEMVIIHRVFRREAALLLRFVTAVRPGDVARAQRIAAAFREYEGGLHHHHALEDQLIWPKLHERARLYQEQVTRMEMQHGLLDDSLAGVRELLPAWEREAGDDVRENLAAALADHRAVLTEHLDDEEALVLPLVAEHLTVAEWDEVGRRGLETVPRDKVMLALGAILEEASPAEQRYFMAKVPAAGRLLWKLVGRHQYRRYTAELRGEAAVR